MLVTGILDCTYNHHEVISGSLHCAAVTHVISSVENMQFVPKLKSRIEGKFDGNSFCVCCKNNCVNH